MAYKGIDYSLGQSNFDPKTGIHFGVIGMHSIMPEATDDFESDYGKPHCPKCGNEVSEVSVNVPNTKEYENYSKHGCDDFACDNCELFLDSDAVYPDEAIGWSYERDGYTLGPCLDNDIFVLASEFYTHAQYCSPCVPGAGNLDTPVEDGVKTFCLSHDWFEEGKAPYRVFKVSDDSEVLPDIHTDTENDIYST